eukprot:9406471-Lingulodinium_polyedra.AAC.1
MERLGTTVVDYESFWDVMDYLYDRGMKEMEGVKEVVSHHMNTMTGEERKQYIRGLEGDDHG